MLKILFYGMMLAVVISTILIQNSHADSTQIPSWIKNNAKWWSQGQVDDSDFIKGIQYLIQKGIMRIPAQANSNITSTLQHIPSWVKTTAGWWSSGQVGDQDFVKGIQYLVDVKIIKIDYPVFVITSSAFENNGTIPAKYTCDGNNTQPPIEISGIPQNTKSLALTVVDVDAPSGPFTHGWCGTSLQIVLVFQEMKHSNFLKGSQVLAQMDTRDHVLPLVSIDISLRYTHLILFLIWILVLHEVVWNKPL